MKVYSVLRKPGRNCFFEVALWLMGILVLTVPGTDSLKAQNSGAAPLPSLSDLQGSYEKARLDGTVPFAEELKSLVNGYEGALGRLQEGLQAKGDLEALLEVREEAKSLKEHGHPGSGEAKGAELAKLRGIFVDSKQAIVSRQAAAMEEITAKYKSALEALVPDLVKAGKVEDAVKAKAMAAAIKVDESEGTEVAPPSKPVTEAIDSSDMAGAGEIPVKVLSRSEKRLTEVPEVEAPLVEADIFSRKDWPILVMIPQGDFKIEGQVKYESTKGRMLAFTDGSSFQGKGDKPYWNVANAIAVGKSLRFEEFNFRGNLGSKLYFERCSFKDMQMGKGGGWFGGAFMSRWQFRSCAISDSFTDKWETRLTGVQMLGCRIEKVDFPPLEYHKEDEPSAIALSDEMMILDSYFYKCEIPVSVLSLTEGCVFADCRFVDDPKPLTFAEKVKRKLTVEDCDVKYKALPANLEFELEDLPRR